MPGVLLKTLGCRLNQSESAEIESAFASHGMRVAERDGDADVVVVNTCTITAESSRSSRRLIRRAIRENPGAEVVVTGCYAVAAPEDVGAIEGVARVVPNKDKDDIAAAVAGPDRSATPIEIRPSRSPLPALQPRATLKVQTGCDEPCTFCIVPQTRGGLNSRGSDSLVDRALDLAARGAREVTLSGVHLGKYGLDLAARGGLAQLARRLLDLLPGEVRIRLSSLEATWLDDELIGLMASEPRLCRHLHLPLQSGDDGVLARMKRPYTSTEYLAIVDRARSGVDGLAVTSDVMVGFPGESKEAFEATLDVVRRADFSKLHVFRYSSRDGTPAAEMGEQIASDEKKERSRRLRKLGDRLRLDFHRREAGRSGRLDVLIESSGPARASDPGRPALYGLTDNYIKVATSGPAGWVGSIASVDVVEVGVDSVLAAPLEGARQRPLRSRR